MVPRPRVRRESVYTRKYAARRPWPVIETATATATAAQATRARRDQQQRHPVPSSSNTNLPAHSLARASGYNNSYSDPSSARAYMHAPSEPPAHRRHQMCSVYSLIHTLVHLPPSAVLRIPSREQVSAYHVTHHAGLDPGPYTGVYERRSGTRRHSTAATPTRRASRGHGDAVTCRSSAVPIASHSLRCTTTGYCFLHTSAARV